MLDLDDINWQNGLLLGGLLLAVLGIVLFLSGGGPGLTDPVVKRTAEKIVRHVQGQRQIASDLTAIRKDRSDLGPVKIYVDRSLSMKPYLADRQQSALYRLLGRLGNFVDSETEFFGFGFRSANDESQEVKSTTPIALKRPSSYQFANNDYGSLFQSFSRRDVTHLIVTDGVQSDPESKAQLGGVLESIDRWVRTGGTFATLLYRTSYRGQYYSDLPGPDPTYNCENRPLTVFALGQSPTTIDDLIARFDQRFRPDHVVRLGENILPVKPVKRSLASDESGRGQRIFRSVEEKMLTDYEQVFTTSVAPKSDANEFVSFQFEARFDRSSYPWKALSEMEIQSFLKNLETETEAFQLNRSRMEAISEAASSPNRAGASVPGEDGEYEPPSLLREIDVHSKEMPEPVVRINRDSVRARFEVPLRRPKVSPQVAHFAFLLRWRVTPQAARMLVPDRYSTNNDLNAENCGQIYKLQQLVGTIMRRNYAPGQALLLTEWR